MTLQTINGTDIYSESLGEDQVLLMMHGGLGLGHGDCLNGLILANTVPEFDYQPVPSGTEEQLGAFDAAFTRPMDDDYLLLKSLMAN